MTGIDDTGEFDRCRFLLVALEQGLLKQSHVETILEHARRTNVQPSDAALTLSMLEPFEVDAVNLLCAPAELASGYVLTGLIGCGAGGMVFRARQVALGRDVAFKTINTQARSSTNGQSRIQREALSIARLHHPHIVAAYDSGFHQGRFCIAMELVEGETLLDFIRRESPIEENVVWRIVRQVASALSHAAAAGITHRDIKPANLLLCDPPSGTEFPAGVPFVKVADFGLAFESEAESASQITATGMTLGTPAYVAPEQLKDTHVGPEADIYSLGATVFHMLGGTPPFADYSPMQLIMQKTIGDDQWRERLPPTVTNQSAALFRQMTQSEPEGRLGNYEELITLIDELLSLEAQPAVGVFKARWTEAGPIRSRRLSAWIASAACFVLIAAGAAAYLLDRSKCGPQSVGAEKLWEVDGFPRPLFNGQSVPLFQQVGSWSPDVAADGSRVLSGKEGAEMTLPLVLAGDPSPNLRLRFSLLVEDDTVIEVGLRHSGESSDLSVMRFEDDRVAFRPLQNAVEPSEPKRIDLSQTAESIPGDFVFQRVAILRLGDRVSVVFNGQQLGSVGCNAGESTSIILRSVKNQAILADIDIVRMSPQAESSIASPEE